MPQRRRTLARAGVQRPGGGVKRFPIDEFQLPHSTLDPWLLAPYLRAVFRPCIDLHEGRVKQIVGGTLSDEGAQTNFVSDRPASWFAELYRKDDLRGGFIAGAKLDDMAAAQVVLAIQLGVP